MPDARQLIVDSKNSDLIFTINCQLSTANCQLSTINCQLSTVYRKYLTVVTTRLLLARKAAFKKKAV